MWDPDKYLAAWNFAARAHRGQNVPGTSISYLNHVGSVAMESIAAIQNTETLQLPDLLIQCALLHDVVEDTEVALEEVEEQFGAQVADGVSALTKNPALSSKRAKMVDSLSRIKKQPVEIWMVKMADRITNLQRPPLDWSREKSLSYQEEALLILDELGAANTYLANRLAGKIEGYSTLID